MKLKEGLLVNKIDDEYVLVDIGKVEPIFNGMVKLNQTSKDIVDLLKEDISFDVIVSSIAKKYNISSNKIENDIKEVIDELKKINLIV